MTDAGSGVVHQVPITSSGASRPQLQGRCSCYFPPWFYALLIKVLHDAHTTVSHFPVGLEQLDNTIETDHLSLVLLECVGGTKIACWLFPCVSAL